MAGEHLLVVDDSPTVLKVVESVLTRAGYRVDTARDAASGIAIARRERPAVILVDSLMPRQTKEGATSASLLADAASGGQELCGALASDEALAHTPIVLMTSKGEEVEARYAQTPNIIDYITKPFSPEAVLAVVTHVIEKNGAGTVPDVLGRTEVGRRSPSSAVAEALLRSAAEKTTLEPEVDAAELRDLEDESAPPDLAGQLGTITVSEVLSLLAAEKLTGAVRVQTDGARVDIFISQGQIDFAAAVGVAEEFLLGRFVIEAGQVSPDVVGAVLQERKNRRRATGAAQPLFGRDLVQRGLLKPADLTRAMRRQTAELIYEALRWPRGHFVFRRLVELPELAQDAALGLSVDMVLLEGFRRVDEWRIIEREIPTFDLVFVRDEERIGGLPRGTLTREEIAVLDGLTGKNTVRDVVRQLRMGSFDVSKILFRLLRTKLIRRRVQPVAAGA